MYGDKANLMPAGTNAVKLFLARDFTNPEFADSVLELGQSLNAYRASDTIPGPFGDAPPIASEEEALAFAAEIDAELPQGFGAAGDGAEAIKPETLARLKRLFTFLVTTVLPLVL